ncbi:MAG: tyrosine-type recombinase/integrase [Acidimicrobiales bacterium]
MGACVEHRDGVHRLAGSWGDVGAANAFLGHLEARAFASATIRAYAFDLVNFARFLEDRGIALAAVVPTDIFDWVDWQAVRRPGRAEVTLISSKKGSAPASVNRRAAAVRAFFEHQVMSGTREDNPVPAPRRGQGLRPKARGPLGHLGPGRMRQGGRLVRQQRHLPESLEPTDVSAFLADLGTHRDRAIVLVMVLGGLRAAEVRSLRLVDVDQGRRQVRVVGKGGRERIVPVDRAFFSELAAYLRVERPAGLATPECFVVLTGATEGRAMTEAGMRSLFRYHRQRSGAPRVRPHRLRHTYGTQLAAAGIDLLVLRELMGHVSPETTASYVHLSTEHIAAEYAAARVVIGR